MTWLALGGAGSIDRLVRVPGHSWWPEEVITDADVVTAAASGPVDVLVCHDAPSAVRTTRVGSRRQVELYDPRLSPPPEIVAWCDSSRRLLDRAVASLKPRLVVHGHHHVAYAGATYWYEEGEDEAQGIATCVGLGNADGAELASITVDLSAGGLHLRTAIRGARAGTPLVGRA